MSRANKLFLWAMGAVALSAASGWLAVHLALAWDAWHPSETLDVRADKAAIVCAWCALVAMPAIFYVAFKIGQIDRRLKK